jgi:hypothetical protein
MQQTHFVMTGRGLFNDTEIELLACGILSSVASVLNIVQAISFLALIFFTATHVILQSILFAKFYVSTKSRSTFTVFAGFKCQHHAQSSMSYNIFIAEISLDLSASLSGCATTGLHRLARLSADTFGDQSLLAVMIISILGMQRDNDLVIHGHHFRITCTVSSLYRYV